MATKTVTSCDITGEICAQVFRMGFDDGEAEYHLELSQNGIKQLLSEILMAMSPDTINEILVRLMGENWKSQAKVGASDRAI